MREILLVSISALLGYIIFSAFSTTSALDGSGVPRVLQNLQLNPEDRKELALHDLDNKKDTQIIGYTTDVEKDKIKADADVAKNKQDKEAEVQIKGLESQTVTSVASINGNTAIIQKKQDNYTYLAMAFLLFLIVVIYLRYQKHLAQMELNQRSEQNELIAKKEYAEKILTLLASGNLTFETERKLLKVLDELNGHHVEKKPDIIYHPNPEIAQITT